MTARIIVLVTLLIAWGLNIFLFMNTGREAMHLLLPATGGFYPFAIRSGESTYYPNLMFGWFLLELLVFVALGAAAFIKRSIALALICSLLWLSSILILIVRFASALSGIH